MMPRAVLRRCRCGYSTTTVYTGELACPACSLAVLLHYPWPHDCTKGHRVEVWPSSVFPVVDRDLDVELARVQIPPLVTCALCPPRKR